MLSGQVSRGGDQQFSRAVAAGRASLSEAAQHATVRTLLWPFTPPRTLSLLPRRGRREGRRSERGEPRRLEGLLRVPSRQGPGGPQRSPGCGLRSSAALFSPGAACADSHSRRRRAGLPVLRTGTGSRCLPCAVTAVPAGVRSPAFWFGFAFS